MLYYLFFFASTPLFPSLTSIIFLILRLLSYLSYDSYESMSLLMSPVSCLLSLIIRIRIIDLVLKQLNGQRKFERLQNPSLFIELI